MNAPTKRRRKSQGYRTMINPSKRHRDRLNVELENLSKLLPYSDDIVSRLDKLSVLRLCVSYVRVKKHFKGITSNKLKETALQPVSSEQKHNFSDEGVFSCLFNEAVDGFIIVVVEDGEIFFIGDSVSHYLGYSQSQMLHQSLYTFLQDQDHEELRNALNPSFDRAKIVEVADNEGESSNDKENDQIPRNLLLRLKSVSNATTSDTYRPFKVVGRLKPLYYTDDDDDESAVRYGLFGICTPAKSTYSMLELRMKSTLFCSKNRIDLSFLDMDASGKDVFGYTKKDLLGRSSYVMVHKSDLQHLKCKHTEIITVGKTTLATFRLLGKNNDWLWVCGYARVLLKNGRPDFVVTTNRLMGDEEGQAMMKNRDDDDRKALARIGFYQPDDPEEACRLGFPQMLNGLGPCPPMPPPQHMLPYAMKDPMMTKMQMMNMTDESAVMMPLTDAAISMNIGNNPLVDEGCNLLDVSDDYFDYPLPSANLEDSPNLFDLSPSVLAPVSSSDSYADSASTSCASYDVNNRQRGTGGNRHAHKAGTAARSDYVKTEPCSPEMQSSCQTGNPHALNTIVRSISNLDVTTPQSSSKVYTTLSDTGGYYDEMMPMNGNAYLAMNQSETQRQTSAAPRVDANQVLTEDYRGCGQVPTTAISYYPSSSVGQDGCYEQGPRSATNTGRQPSQEEQGRQPYAMKRPFYPEGRSDAAANAANASNSRVPPNVTLSRSNTNLVNLNSTMEASGMRQTGSKQSHHLPAFLQQQLQQQRHLQQQQQQQRRRQQQLQKDKTKQFQNAASAEQQLMQEQFHQQMLLQQQQAINNAVFPPASNFNSTPGMPLQQQQVRFGMPFTTATTSSFSSGRPVLHPTNQSYTYQ